MRFFVRYVMIVFASTVGALLLLSFLAYFNGYAGVKFRLCLR